ncbi:MAG: Crp/Fnr family transcriptional regulator [Chloroflexi bacterium]|nr:Crp/Fnr family transcriptional regulator [Chloroflexota bacterium]
MTIEPYARRAEPERVARALREVPLFATVPEPYFGEIAERVRLRHYEAGEIIFYQHDAGEGLYLLARGAVRIFLRSDEGQELTIARFDAGDFFGELAAIDEEPRSATAVAVEPTDLLILHRDDFLSYLRARPEAAVFCLRVLARRLRQTDAQLGDTTFLPLPGRLAKTLLELGHSHGMLLENGSIRLTLRLTQSELASMVGGTRPTVNQLLQRFRRLGWITTEGRSLTLVQTERLRRLTE